jgi:hypothetical protein
MNDEGDELLNIYLNISTACSLQVRARPAEARRDGQKGLRSKERGPERAQKQGERHREG